MRLDDLLAIETEQDQLRDGLEGLREQSEALAERYKGEVTEPVTTLREGLRDAMQVIKASERALGLGPAATPMSRQRSISALRDLVESIMSRQASLLTAAAAARLKVEDQRSGVSAKLEDIFEQAGAKDLQAMTDAKLDADVESRSAAAASSRPKTRTA